MNYWTAEDVENLKLLIAEKLTARQIGERLGRSKSSVISKVHGLKLTLGHSHGWPDNPNCITAVPIKPEPEVKPTEFKSIIDLRLDQCRWPTGDVGNENFFFCGEMVKDGKSYCSEHCERSYVSVREYNKFKEPNSSTRFNFKSR